MDSNANCEWFTHIPKRFPMDLRYITDLTICDCCLSTEIQYIALTMLRRISELWMLKWDCNNYSYELVFLRWSVCNHWLLDIKAIGHNVKKNIVKWANSSWLAIDTICDVMVIIVLKYTQLNILLLHMMQCKLNVSLSFNIWLSIFICTYEFRFWLWSLNPTTAVNICYI